MRFFSVAGLGMIIIISLLSLNNFLFTNLPESDQLNTAIMVEEEYVEETDVVETFGHEVKRKERENFKIDGGEIIELDSIEWEKSIVINKQKETE